MKGNGKKNVMKCSEIKWGNEINWNKRFTELMKWNDEMQECNEMNEIMKWM